ncbi:N-6 DNA methylase [Streptomyces sp. 3212.3]|uniref:N-6 DNA methylase n=1 Tax=Streptomyces sp. 3212.3 TaxID=1938846 RepID=UPI000E222EDA|nr:N-6 DNA methylase [Streptomyces sp. 3212.3]REE61479.1 N-6 DNA methylase [Streptomyces sp. 3212.3]
MDQLDLFAAAEEVPATFAARPARPPAPRPATETPRPVVAAAVPDALFADPRPEPVAAPEPARRTIRPILLGNPREAGQRLGEAVAEAWHASNWGGYRMDIPVSIVAALALFPIKGHTEVVTRIISTATDWQLLQGYREIYAATWSRRPDLGARMAPLMGWLTEDGVEEKAYAVRRVTETALRYGILQMTGDPDPGNRADTDLMSWTITSLRSHGARQGLGEYHTPPELCDMMARTTVGDEPPKKGSWFHEPAGGSGGMFRALAQHLRHLRLDPADYGWAINDIDPLAAAGAAVNAIVWGLGQNVVVSCGDALRQGDVIDQAIRERAALIEERNEIVSRIAVAEAFEQAIRLADSLLARA